VAPSLGSVEPKGYDGAAEADDIQGTWASESYGRGRDAGEWAGWTLTFFRGGYEFRMMRLEYRESGTYRAGLHRGAHHLDLTPATQNESFIPAKNLYQVSGDTLRLAWAPKGDRRPAAFDEEGAVVVTFKRVKQ